MDLASGLTQVLDDGTNTYLYGNGRIAQMNAAGTEYFLGDALGSVRQMTDAAGAVTSAKGYDAYGVVSMTSGSGTTSYGYTGEMSDTTGMVYLRSRMYAPSIGRFLTRDTWGGDAQEPMSFNRWGYVSANPINFSDPSGMRANNQDINPRDLTYWLHTAMVVNANSAVVRNLRKQNELAAVFARGVICELNQALIEAEDKGVPLPEVIKSVIAANWSVILSAAYMHVDALLQYKDLVKDGAVWDFKDEIGRRLGPGITLCGARCYNNIEYSVSGNIHFAYIGAAAGFPGYEIQAGAGYAEITDPAHNPNSNQYSGPYIPLSFWQLVGWTPWDLSTINFGDEAKDHEAVTLGIKLWEKHNGILSLVDFMADLSTSANKFSKCEPNAEPVITKIASQWPYWNPGFFDNQGASYVLPSGRCE